MTIPPVQSQCPECGQAFKYRSNKKFCSANCRKAESQRKSRSVVPVNAANNLSVRREQHEVYELALRMGETLYGLPPSERLGYIESIIQLARRGQCPRVRQILTNPTFIKPDPNKKFLFHRGLPRSFCTIAQAANRYCLMSPWNASVDKVVRGQVPDPPTGEVMVENALAA